MNIINLEGKAVFVKAQFETPQRVAEKITKQVLEDKEVKPDDRILFPGCGKGPFISAVQRYCKKRGIKIPELVGVEEDLEFVEKAQKRHQDAKILEADFLREDLDIDKFDYILGNPPYVPIENITEPEKKDFRKRFSTAQGRFDYYFLFFEKGLRHLKRGGTLSFLTPEKFEYVHAASSLRETLSQYNIKRIEHLSEDVFENVSAYPTVTTITKASSKSPTVVEKRDGSQDEIKLPTNGESWASHIRNHKSEKIQGDVTLEEVTKRISVGVATGADSIFVRKREEVPRRLEKFTYPTISGRRLTLEDVNSNKVFICPYDEKGELRDEENLTAYLDWAAQYRKELEDRSCVRKHGKKWYAWHEKPAIEQMLQPKILFRDVSQEPKFWLDREGKIIPRHSVYYLIPKEGYSLEKLYSLLNDERANYWLQSHTQRVENGYIRLQTKVLEDMPLPKSQISY